MKAKPRYTAGGRITSKEKGIWTGGIDAKGELWFGCVMIHRKSHAEVKRVRDLILKVLNK